VGEFVGEEKEPRHFPEASIKPVRFAPEDQTPNLSRSSTCTAMKRGPDKKKKLSMKSLGSAQSTTDTE
jgi:hypothetical protein